MCLKLATANKTVFKPAATTAELAWLCMFMISFHERSQVLMVVMHIIMCNSYRYGYVFWNDVISSLALTGNTYTCLHVLLQTRNHCS